MSKGWQDITTEEVEKRLSADSSLQLIDVRNPDEYEDGHIQGAKLIPLPELPARIDFDSARVYRPEQHGWRYAGLDRKTGTQLNQEGYI